MKFFQCPPTRTTRIRFVILPLFVLLLLASQVYSQSTVDQTIVTLAKGCSIREFVKQYQLTVINELGETGPGTTLLVMPPSGVGGDQLRTTLAADRCVVFAEPNVPAMTRESDPAQSGSLAQSTVALLNQSSIDLLSTSSTINYYGGLVKSIYANQPALILIQNPLALQSSTGIGVVVADIDNGVDTDNPVLQNVLVPGYNFVDNNFNVSEWAGLDQSTVALLNQNQSLGLDQSTVSLLNQSTVSLLNQSTVSLLNQSTVALLNQSTVGLLNQSTVALLNQSTVALLNQSTVGLLNQLPRAFGHGTMVAGLIHVVAPNARIMPLKAFRPDGTGSVYDVARAIIWAANMNVDVINMSFSFDGSSKTLQSAINYAQRRGIFLVTSTGNNGMQTTTWPAGYGNVYGIASTDDDDIVAPFSNYGTAVSFTAPGVHLVTFFPGGHYAQVSGTSFSSALVAGMAALAASLQHSAAGRLYAAMNIAAVDIDSLNPSYANKLGRGRVDSLQTLRTLMGK